MRVGTLTASFLLDWIVGDPEFLPHPVRVIGKTIAAGERTLRRQDRDRPVGIHWWISADMRNRGRICE